eukprot:6213585-Pleurochrysis_carterae.AAC.2
MPASRRAHSKNRSAPSPGRRSSATSTRVCSDASSSTMRSSRNASPKKGEKMQSHAMITSGWPPKVESSARAPASSHSKLSASTAHAEVLELPAATAVPLPPPSPPSAPWSAVPSLPPLPSPQSPPPPSPPPPSPLPPPLPQAVRIALRIALRSIPSRTSCATGGLSVSVTRDAPSAWQMSPGRPSPHPSSSTLASRTQCRHAPSRSSTSLATTAESQTRVPVHVPSSHRLQCASAHASLSYSVSGSTRCAVKAGTQK